MLLKQLQHNIFMNGKVQGYYEPGCITTIELPLRRTLVRSELYCILCLTDLKQEIIKQAWV